MRRFGSGAFLAIAILVGVVGVVAYNLGVSAGTADAAIAAGASVIYAPATLSPFAIILGLFFLVLVIGFIARAISGPRWGPGPGYWRHHRGSWDHETVPEPFRPMLERWHREAHGSGADSQRARPAAATGPAAPAGPGAPPPPGGPAVPPLPPAGGPA